jgi:hypothetical protein
LVQTLAVVAAPGELLGCFDEQDPVGLRASQAERANALVELVELVAEDPHGGPGRQVIVSHYLLVPAETEP